MSWRTRDSSARFKTSEIRRQDRVKDKPERQGYQDWKPGKEYRNNRYRIQVSNVRFRASVGLLNLTNRDGDPNQ